MVRSIQNISGTPATQHFPTFAPSSVDLQKIRESVFGVPARSPDILVGLSGIAIQKFLAAHYTNNPDFYDRSRQKNPNNPIYEHTFNDHGTQRRVRFWAKVDKVAGQPAVYIDLKSDRASRARFRPGGRLFTAARARLPSRQMLK